ncbi:MAG TPA: ComF family protein [Ignavibacteriaceae bacterium]|nr:ComF family protein [Ignavibacteriaceae bacterium]
MIKSISKILNDSMETFLPRICTGCESRLSNDELVICNDCLNDLVQVDEAAIKEEYDNQFREFGFVKDIFSLFRFEKGESIQKIIFSIKYGRRFKTAKYLGELLGEGILQNRESWEYSFIIPIPLHKVRLSERGFNQSEYIATGVKTVTGIAIDNSIIKRVKYTETQTKKHKTERIDNMKNAFGIINKENINGKSVLLVDDVITTGSTINAVADVLMKNGAKNIFVASVALA